MSDIGTKKTEKEIKKVENKIDEVYSEALSDINGKLDDFHAKFKVKEEIYLKKLSDGKITQEQYNNWVSGQVFQGEQWVNKKNQILNTLTNSNKVAVNMVNGGMYGVFAFNSNYQAYEIEKGFGVDFGFGLYDTTTVKNLIKNDPQILPKWKINEKKDYIWNEKKLNNAITQGIIQGEGLDKISKRISTGLCSQNENLMKTFARTGMTQAQNAGRYQRQMDAKKLGINMVKEWMATLDGRTRDSHRHMDGEQIKVGDKWHPQKFSNGCRYPGDPEAPPKETYNCRCTLVADLVDYPSEYERYDNIDGKPIKNMTYDEWEKVKRGNVRVTSSINTVVNGKDISATWQRRPDQFDFEIEDIINAQGFDGLPRVVPADEFDKYVQKSNFIAQRGYTAPNRETLNSYQEQLYYGKWYVDCSRGGSLNGQGMNAIGNIGTSLSQSSIEFAKEYSTPPSGVGKVETFTVDESAKVITSSDLGEILWDKLDNAKTKEDRNRIEKLSEDQGRFAALLGYDVLQVNQRGSDDKIFIVLNRTKVIFKGE